MQRCKEDLLIAAERKGEKYQESTYEKNPEPIEVRFGKRVHELRLQRRLPQEELANLAQVHRNYVSDMERGKRNVSIRIVDQIARALGVEIKELFE